ncbi:MAG: 16S rRNA (uracil(1498)-N(3))-methyltransferase, partial [Clostridiales bacterium]|nr:16S rRNA (uracil(1498)-N(3))-methyltransferase [Clostridiales bacterium]
DYTYTIQAIRKNETVLALVEKVPNDRDATLRATLFCAVMKGDKNDLVAQKATELGVSEIYPVITEYVQAHDRNLRVDRLERIVREAAKQCGRSTYPTVSAPVDFDQMAGNYPISIWSYSRTKRHKSPL